MSNLTYRAAIFLYAFLFLMLTFPFWLNGEVLTPHRQFSELAMVDQTGATQLENHKFNDFTNGYIPEISEHLHGARSGWITLWTNKNELGRPTYQISGFSPAYPLSWLIAQFTDSPWRFITCLSLLTCVLAGLFIILYCSEIGLSPWAGLVAGISLASSPLFMYWLTFPMFPAVWCWSAGALWAIVRLSRAFDILGWAALAFSTYSLLMTAYPQPVVFHAYILGGYGFVLVYCKWKASSLDAKRFVISASAALVVGAGLAFPVYRDLAILSAESARVAPDPSFFTANLPTFSTFNEVVRFFVLSTVPELFGNPISSNFPLSYDGLSVTLLVVFFSIAGVFLVFRQIWGWWLAIAVLCLLTFFHPFYLFGVKFLGFNLSRSTPLGSIMLPLTVIMAFGVDALFSTRLAAKIPAAVITSVICLLGIIILGLVYGLENSLPIRWDIVLLMLFITGLMCAQYRKIQPRLIILALIIVLISVSYPLVLRQDPAQIATNSPLAEKVRMNLDEGSRFSVVSQGISVLPPNFNAGLGLSSIHSYNSLSSTRYHTLIKSLGGDLQTYGRWNGFVAPDYSSSIFWMSNISLILSSALIEHENLKYIGNESGIYLYKVIARMGDSLQVVLPKSEINSDKLNLVDVRLLAGHAPKKLIDDGDRLEFEVIPESPSLFFLSQKFHRDWKAQVLIKDVWEATATVEVNGIFQGVLLPSDVRRVRLEFKPFAYYSWIAHVFWLLLLIYIVLNVWRKKFSNKTRIAYE